MRPATYTHLLTWLAQACAVRASRRCLAAALAALALLPACSLLPPAPDAEPLATPWEQAGKAGQTGPQQAGLSAQALPSVWRHQAFPGKKSNQYEFVRLDGRPTMAVQSEAAASVLRQVVHRSPADLGQVKFSWKVSALIPTADLDQRDKSDSPVRLVLAFDGDRSRLSGRDALLSELARSLTGEEMPYATLMYVWSNNLPLETVVTNKRTSRIRKLVVETGPDGLNRWRDYQRDIRADYERVFGEAPGALLAVGIMTDTDNTGGTVQAWYGPVALEPLASSASSAALASVATEPPLTPK